MIESSVSEKLTLKDFVSTSIIVLTEVLSEGGVN